jgi:PAS domain S-box-containing protein
MTSSSKHPAAINNLYEMLNDCSIDRVMAINKNWEVIAWNNTAAIITGIDKRAILGKHLLVVFPQLKDDPDMINAIEHALAGRKSFLGAQANTFNRQHYENHFIPLPDNDGQIIGVMNIMHDVAHRQKAENQLQQLNRELEQKYRQLETATTELATYTYITSNDIKAPLRQVYTAFELLVKNEGKVLSNGGKANLRRIQGSLNRMNLLLDDILALSHINSFMQVRKAVNLKEVLQHALIALKNKVEEKRAKITTGDLPTVEGFKEMLQTLFMNIIDNAIKFQTPDNIPQLTISGKIVAASALPAAIPNRQQDALVITFTDNGIGFEPHNASRIFIMFEKLHPKTEYPGSGMGLTIAKKIMEAHNGFIEAQSTPGLGTIISCYLPVGSGD